MKNILIIEDEKLIAYDIEKKLQRSSFKTTIADSYDEIKNKIKIKVFDLILSDIMLPGEKDGIEIVEEFYYKPENGNFDNYLIENILSISIDTVIPGTAISFQHTYNINSLPPEGYKKEDTFFSVGISVDL